MRAICTEFPFRWHKSPPQNYQANINILSLVIMIGKHEKSSWRDQFIIYYWLILHTRSEHFSWAFRDTLKDIIIIIPRNEYKISSSHHGPNTLTFTLTFLITFSQKTFFGLVFIMVGMQLIMHVYVVRAHFSKRVFATLNTLYGTIQYFWHVGGFC